MIWLKSSQMQPPPRKPSAYSISLNAVPNNDDELSPDILPHGLSPYSIAHVNFDQDIGLLEAEY